MRNDVEELLLCNCTSCEHQVIIRYDNDEDEVYLSIHLFNGGFWSRIHNAIKYIFGHKSCYGDFDEVILRKCDADKLQKVVDKLKNIKHQL